MNDDTIMAETGIAERYRTVRERIEKACARARRDPADIQLVAVSKGHDPEHIREAMTCGVTVFGESKVQEARAKIPQCPEGLTWHLVGHLQTNKIKHAVPLFDVVHSVDSLKRLTALDDACDAYGRTLQIFVEVNVSGEKSKFGLKPEAASEVLEATLQCRRLELRGLMTMAPLASDPEKTRPYFRQLREWRDQWSRDLNIPMSDLSMGMTNDFEVAIEEGATYIRVGTALFGERG